MENIFKKASVIWISLLFYLAAVEIILLIKSPEQYFSFDFVLPRLILLAIFGICHFLKNRISDKNWFLINIVAVYASLTLLYKETGMLNQYFYPVHDPSLMLLDKKLFGFQPALEFSKHFSSAFFSELMFFGYFSYYLMPLVIILLIYRNLSYKLEEFGFVLITSFLIYYFIFILIPAIGPQFYWDTPDNYIETKGIFGKLIKLIQENGEVPTAAFPSSHVGIAVIMLIWLWKNNRKYFKYFIPSVTLLVFATIYIKAHYAVDVLAGFITAPAIYFLSAGMYSRVKIFLGQEVESS